MAKRRRLPSKKQLIIAGGAIALIVIGLFVWGRLAETRHPLANQSNDAPGYQTISPEGRSIEQLGGWRRVSPPNEQPVYAFEDTIGSVSISVSQQPLPSSFESNTNAKIAELAKSYNATNKLTVDNTIVYIGTSAQGPQSVIFTKDGLLILIKSQAIIDDQAWKQYIAGLVRSKADVSPQY